MLKISNNIIIFLIGYYKSKSESYGLNIIIVMFEGNIFYFFLPLFFFTRFACASVYARVCERKPTHTNKLCLFSFFCPFFSLFFYTELVEVLPPFLRAFTLVCSDTRNIRKLVLSQSKYACILNFNNLFKSLNF